MGGLAGGCRADYPVAARRRGEQGQVVVRATVAPDGHATAAAIAASSGHASLDAAAVAAVLRACRFAPAQHGGVPVSGTALQPIDFILGSP